MRYKWDKKQGLLDDQGCQVLQIVSSNWPPPGRSEIMVDKTDGTSSDSELLTKTIDFAGDLQEKVYKLDSRLSEAIEALEKIDSALDAERENGEKRKYCIRVNMARGRIKGLLAKLKEG